MKVHCLNLEDPDYLTVVCHSLVIFCFHLQTAHSDGNWKVRFSRVWLTQTVRKTQAVSTESLVLWTYVELYYFCSNDASKQAYVKVNVSIDGKSISADSVLLLMPGLKTQMGVGQVDVKRFVRPTLHQLLLYKTQVQELYYYYSVPHSGHENRDLIEYHFGSPSAWITAAIKQQ